MQQQYAVVQEEGEEVAGEFGSMPEQTQKQQQHATACSPGVLKLTESKMVLSLQFVLESSFVAHICDTGDTGRKIVIPDTCFVLSGTHRWCLPDAFGQEDTKS